ncbi:MAG TPA: hypothetical protein VN699_19505 [Pirellulales bacterium]|nr:hypothetical protein [Pirellulales bacterium]
MDRVRFSSRRISNAGLALIGVAAPFFAIYGLMALLVNRRPTRPNAGPNPNPAPLSIWAPNELLVYVDPWFTGVLAHWLVFSAAVAGLFVAAILLAWPIEAGGQSTRRCLLATISLLIGAVLSAPWAYGLIHLLVQRH